MKPEILEMLTWRDLEEIFKCVDDTARLFWFREIRLSEQELFEKTLNRLKEKNH